MINLTTRYLGLDLKSPVIVSSSRLTSNIENLETAEESGAGAIVLKSLFEEQIMHHINQLSSEGYPEAEDYIRSYTLSNTVDEYISLVRNSKKRLKIPVIASINCYTAGNWIDFAAKMQDAGADALEINAFFMPFDKRISSSDSEKLYLELAEKVVARVSIPVAMKLGFRFSNILYLVDQLYMRGIKGVVMFNRFFEPDIDVERVEIIPAQIFSNESDMRHVLRWIAMTSAQDMKTDISASTGVTGGEDVIKYLLAGADTVQVCSILYKEGIPFLREINHGISSWMKAHSFSNISDFRGKLNRKNSKHSVLYERTQFMKYFSSSVD
jgi:dihydroorotate dehydrogenase (fumarate)